MYWSTIRAYSKNCSLICAGEYIPQEEEALLNRFIILDTKEPFLIKKNVRDDEEFRKYETLTGGKLYNKFLTTEQIKLLAVNYYRPRFLNILMNKRKVNFKEYYKEADRIVDLIAKEFSSDILDARLVNNLKCAITGYLIICGDSMDEEEVKEIVSEYFTDLLNYKRDAYIS